ncbi:MAG: N-6 DNA methylase [Armatimonadota bacterium]
MSAIAQYLRALRRTREGAPTEHSYRPALQALLQALRPGAVATNEPQHKQFGAVDFRISTGTGAEALTIGYVECKDIGAALDEVERSEQLKRYRDNLPSLVLTDYLEFRWYVDGERRATARLAHVDASGRIATETGGPAAVEELLTSFLQHAPEPIRDPQDLARRMARLTRQIADIVRRQLASGDHRGEAAQLHRAFQDTLLPNIEADDFADMYAQTLAYGLFAARVNHRPGTPFTRRDAAAEIPKTNPFLRRLFDAITGVALDDEPYVGYVDDLTRLLAHADMGAILADFGARTRRDDPIVHFYETFLAAHDPELREMRGVYYTPEPVVSYIVRSVDWILKEHFGLPDGLADRSTVEYEVNLPDGTTEKRTSPKVLILDPACGTGTFLYHVIDHIRQQFVRSNNAGMWPGFVREQLLPRLFGFELLMAPYAVAHLKLGMQLAALDMTEEQRAKWAYNFESDERLGVYLTNTLEEGDNLAQRQFGVMKTIADEANAASEVKHDLPIMVIIGNPPYSKFSVNDGPWMDQRLASILQDHCALRGGPDTGSLG